jgi:hypothetical protein
VVDNKFVIGSISIENNILICQEKWGRGDHPVCDEALFNTAYHFSLITSSTDAGGGIFDNNWRFIHIINLRMLKRETDKKLEKL